MALMYSVMLFINASLAMIVIGYEFLALVNLLVYVGALAVLFLFVIMLLEIPATELRAYQRGWSTLALAGVAAISVITGRRITTLSYSPSFEGMEFIGHAFYTRYADLLLLNSLVLTVALFGALVLAHLRRGG